RLTATRNTQGEEVRRRWDSRGRLIALENENGEAYQFRWGADSLLLEEVGLDGVASQYRYDACGRTIARTFAAGHPEAITHAFAWSASGQLVARTTPEGQTRYHYTPSGLLSRIGLHPALSADAWSAEAEQELVFEYDALGRVTRETCEHGELAWQYDALGNRTSVTLPDGRELKQFYYGSGHLLSIALDKLSVSDFTRDELHRETSRTQGLLTTRSEYDRLGRLHRRDVFTGNAQRPSPRRWSRRWDYDYRNNLVREERDDNPFSWYRWQYDSAGRLLVQDGTLPGQEQWRWDAAGNPLEGSAEKVTHNRLTQLNGIRWCYDIHGRTVEKDNGQTRWHYRYDGEHRLTEVISQPRDRNRPQTQVSFRYDPLGRRISKTRRQMLGGQPTGKPVTTRFVWEGFRLLQEVHGDVPLTYVYSDQDSYDPLARIDGVDAPEIFWFHCQPNGTPERMTDSEGQVRWEGVNSAWGKLLRESETQVSGYSQNLRMQGQYLDRETGLHYNLFRYYDPDCGRFTQQDPIGLAGGINLYQYAPNALGWVDPWGLSCRNSWNDFQNKTKGVFSSRAWAAKAYNSLKGTTKPNRPNPTNYLDPSYVKQHLALFNDGISKIAWGVNRAEIGPPSGHFVMPKSVADNIIKKAGGDVGKLEKMLGLDPGDLGDSPVRIDILKPQGLRMPSGNEGGANDFWVPGGKTSGGIPEAVIDQTPVGDALITPIINK
ncbi:RHS repeat protein, partial [Enterobacter sp. CM29]